MVSIALIATVLSLRELSMISLLFGIAMAAITSDQPTQQNYAEAYRNSVSQQKPLLVVVGAPWCPACNSLKESTILPMAETGELDGVSLAMINKDEDPELAKELTAGEQMIPQIILYTPDHGTWKRQRLTGFQSKQPIRNLIRRALGSS
jgi:thioredoxin-like negative regulator of GroEL